MKAISLPDILRKNANTFAPVVPFDPKTDKLIRLNLGNDSGLTAEIVKDVRSFTEHINTQLLKSNARYAIGGYGELRQVYANSSVFDSTKPGTSPRRFHLAVDIWGKPNTAVMAPMESIIHSLGNNDTPGDYGATIILTHKLEHHTFYSLYGHLSINSLKNLSPGMTVRAGETFAEFGIPSENGQWPPHLHFQLIIDINQWHGDYPGVCAIEEKEFYLKNCPDPDLVLQLNRYL